MRKKILSIALIFIFFTAAGGCTSKNNVYICDDSHIKTGMFLKCTAATQKEEPVTKLVISAAGDCTFGSDIHYCYHNSFEDYYNRYGYKYFFNNVKQVFLNDDFTVVNLECALTNSTKYANKEYVYKGKPEYSKILSASGVELVTLANNHTNDYLKKGFNDTINALNKENIKYAYYDNIQIMKKVDIKAAFISVCSWSCSKEMLKNYFRKADQLGADIKILCVHWGKNYEKNYDCDQKKFGHMAVDLGADLILGHHPHILQGIEMYKKVPIVYSLGNFCYAGKKKLGNEINTMIFQMEYQFNGKILCGTKYKIIPVYMSSKNPQNTYRPTIVTDLKEKTKIINLIYSLSKNLK